MSSATRYRVEPYLLIFFACVLVSEGGLLDFANHNYEEDEGGGGRAIIEFPSLDEMTAEEREDNRVRARKVATIIEKNVHLLANDILQMWAIAQDENEGGEDAEGEEAEGEDEAVEDEETGEAVEEAEETSKERNEIESSNATGGKAGEEEDKRAKLVRVIPTEGSKDRNIQKEEDKTIKGAVVKLLDGYGKEKSQKDKKNNTKKIRTSAESNEGTNLRGESETPKGSGDESAEKEEGKISEKTAKMSTKKTNVEHHGEVYTKNTLKDEENLPNTPQDPIQNIDISHDMNVIYSKIPDKESQRKNRHGKYVTNSPIKTM